MDSYDNDLLFLLLDDDLFWESEDEDVSELPAEPDTL